MAAERPEAGGPTLTTIGDAVWDTIVTAEHTRVVEQGGAKFVAYPYGEKIYLQNASFGYGGGAANVAVSAARLGIPTSFIGAVGTDHVGESVLEHFRAEGVATDHVKRDSDHLNGLSIVLAAPDGERTILVYHGANEHLTEKDIDWEQCRKSDWLYVSSLSGEAGPLYDEVAAVARTNGTKLAMNPGSTQVKRGSKGLHQALEGCAVLILNEEEAAELLNQRDGAAETVSRQLEDLAAITGGIVVITRGPEGSAMRCPDGEYSIGTLTDTRLNTLGAGDAFSSTFVVSIMKGLPPTEALRYASINASSVVSEYGAQAGLLPWAELERQAAGHPEFVPRPA